MINVVAEFCFWVELRRNRSSILHLGLAETLEVPNTVSDATLSSFQWSIKQLQAVSDL
jgi:hypothetical protein